MPPDQQRGEFTLNFDPARLDRAAIHGFLSQTYWAKHRSRALMDRAIAGALCVGLFHPSGQIGFARAVTDRATFAYLADVYVLKPFRRQGLARWMVGALLNHPDLAGLRRWMLMTEDAQALYETLGFAPLAHPGNCLERLTPYPSVLPPG
jgi:GNAT superfamily N-acetyltransferase